VEAKVVIDQAATYAIAASAQIQAVKNGQQIIPHLEVVIPNRRPVTLGGSVFRGAKKVIVDLNLQNALVDPISVKGK